MPSFLNIPKVSAPLAKAIRTSEGILVWVSNLALAAGALVDPSKLPPKEAAIVAGALSAAHIASRTVLKVTALQQGAGIEAPIPFNPLPAAAAGEVEQTIADGVQLAGTLSQKPATAITPDGAQPLAPAQAEAAAGPMFGPGATPAGTVAEGS
jgi:hypothetical protein